MISSGNTILKTGGSTEIVLEMDKQFTTLKNRVIVTGRNLDQFISRLFPSFFGQMNTSISNMHSED